MDVIGSEIQRLDRVVQMLVDFTRPVDLRLAEIDLRKLVDDVVQLASPDAEQHQVRIERPSSPEPLPARIDVDLVKQAILNIVLNGVQAMPQGGTLRLSCRREGDGALVTVRDQVKLGAQFKSDVALFDEGVIDLARLDRDLTLHGLRVIWERIKGASR